MPAPSSCPQPASAPREGGATARGEAAVAWTPASLAWLGLLLALGFLGNYCRLTLFFGVDFLFGGIVVLLVLYFYGLAWGLLASLAAGSYTCFLWHHPYALVIFTLETLFLGLLLRHRRGHLVLLDLLFWVFLGTPLVWVFYHSVLGMDGTATLLIMLKQSVNGLFNALVASLAINYLPLARLLGTRAEPRQVTLQETLFNLMVALVLLPALLITVLMSRQQMARMETRSLTQLEELSADLSDHLRLWFLQHLGAVREAAALAARTGMQSTAELQRALELLKKTFPDLHNLYVADARGTTIAFYPPVNERGEPTIGLNFADRPYFRLLKATEEPVVSEVFQGRGGVFSPIVTISVPVLVDKEFQGFALGAVNLDRVRQLLQPFREREAEITLVDTEGRGAASTVPARAAMQVFDRKKGGVTRPLKASVYQWMPADPKLPAMLRWKGSFLVKETVIAPDLPWTLIVDLPLASLQKQLYHSYLRNLAIMLGLVVPALLLALVLSGWIARPLAHLARATSDLPGQLSGEPLAWPDSSAAEIHSLIGNFRSMAQALKENFQELTARGRELETINRTLEAEVQERSGAQEALRWERERLYSLLDGLPAYVYLLAPDYSIRFANRRFRESFGEPGGRTCFAALQGRGEPCEPCRIREVFTRQRPKEWQWTSPGGRVYQIYDYPFADIDGSPLVLEMGIDVTERQRAEEALRQSEERYRSLVENINLGISLQDAHHRIIMTNAAQARMFNKDPREFVGKECFREYEKREEVCPHCPGRKAMATGLPARVETGGVRDDGSRFVAHLHAFPIRAPDGQAAGFIEVVEDITERRQAEEALRRSEERYRLLAENSRDVIWTTDLNLNCTYLSPAIEALTGYPPEEALSLKPEQMFTPASADLAHQTLAEELAREETGAADPARSRTLDLEFRRRDGGSVWAELRMAFLRDGQGRPVGVVGVARNLTERRRMEEEKAALEAHLQQAQKLEAIGTLAGGIAHDFNNLLAALQGYTELSLLQLEQEPEPGLLKGNLEAMLQAEARARDLVQQLLTFSRRREQETQPVQVELIVKEALKLLRASLPATIEIRPEIEEDTGLVLADPSQVHQVVMNLCTNAYQAMREGGGLLEVRLEKVEVEAEAGPQPTLPPGPYLRLTVRDTGHGMPPEVRERLFEPYFTTRPPGEGSGLGLAVVHGIVSRLGGAVEVESQVGEGSTFRVYFPRLARPPAPETADDREIPSGKERILFVDDEKQIVQVGKRLLEHLGYQVTAKESSVEALNAFQAETEAFDLVITDQTMPQMTGVELAAEMMHLRKDIPIILCTGYSEVVSAEHAKELGIREYLLKPIVARDLARAIRRVLDQPGQDN